MAGSDPVQHVRLDKAYEADERLLIEAAQEDRARFADLYEKYFELVYAFVSRRTRNREETEDVTAEVFRKALQNLARFRWTGAPFAAWLFRIATNLIADRAKRAAREGKIGVEERLSKGADAPGLTAELPQGGESGPSQAQQTELEDAERQARLFRMVDELGADQKQVVIMRFVEEKSIRDIANQLGRSEGAVKQLQFRALQNLRARLES